METPQITAKLQRQLEAASVINRENTGGGFLTTIAVAHNAPSVSSSSVLGYETQAHIAGLENGFGFVLFMIDSKLHMLEGFAWGPESTTDLDIPNLRFEIYHQLVQRLG